MQSQNENNFTQIILMKTPESGEKNIIKTRLQFLLQGNGYFSYKNQNHLLPIPPSNNLQITEIIT